MSKRDPKLFPTDVRYDGMFSRLCDFLGIGTGSMMGNFEAFRKMKKGVMHACAAEYGGDLNSYAVYGNGRLVFVRKDGCLVLDGVVYRAVTDEEEGGAGDRPYGKGGLM